MSVAERQPPSPLARQAGEYQDNSCAVAPMSTAGEASSTALINIKGAVVCMLSNATEGRGEVGAFATTKSQRPWQGEQFSVLRADPFVAFTGCRFEPPSIRDRDVASAIADEAGFLQPVGRD